MATLRVFARRIERLAQDVREGSHDKVVAAAILLDKALVRRTPVDTGRARANWLVGVNRPRREVSDSTSASGAIALATATALASRPGDSIFVSNNLPYIDVLNEGWSLQAPPGFVEDAVRQTLTAVRRTRLLGRRRGRR